MQKLGIYLSVVAAFAFFAMPTMAQSNPKSAKADIVFELQLSRLTDSELAKTFGWKTMLQQQGTAMAANGEPDFSKAKRIFAGLQSPEKIEDLAQAQAGQGEMEFFVQLEFEDAAAAAAMMKKPMEDNNGVVEKNGKKYFKAPPAQGVPTNAVAYLVNDTTVAMASEGFAFNNSLAISDGAMTSWKAMPDQAIRLTIDGAQARDFMNSLAAEGKKNSPTPMANAFFDLLPGMDAINLSIDLSSDNLLTLNATGADSEKANDMGDALQAIVTIGAGQGKQGLAGLKEQDPESAKVLAKLLDGINVDRDGKSITLSVPRPEGFEDTTQRLVQQFAPLIGMFMPGLGGPAPGF